MTPRYTEQLAERVRDYAGLRSFRRVRSTGVEVGLYSNAEAGIDGDRDNPWALICETHSSICTFTTYKAAQSYQAHPEEWCEHCRAIMVAKEAPNGYR